MSEIAAKVPAEQFGARKCTFLELFQVPGTPKFLKICREVGERVEDMVGQALALGEAVGQVGKSEWPASQVRWPAGHLPKVGAFWSFSDFLYIHTSIASETAPPSVEFSPLAL